MQAWVKEKFDLDTNQTTISNTLKRSAVYLSEEMKNSDAKRHKSAKYPDLEKVLYEWILQRQEKVNMSGEMIQSKAKEFFQKIYDETNQEFSFSSGWLERFKEMMSQIHMEMDDDVFENTHRGCIWGIFRALNYSYWQNNSKRRLSYRKHCLPKFSKGTGRRKTRLISYNSEESRISVSSNTRKTSSTNKRSLRTRIKSLISNETPKKERYVQRVSGSPIQSRSQQTYSNHDLETSDYFPLRRTQSYSEVNKLKNKCYHGIFNKSGREHFLEKYEADEDVLEMYRANQDLFSKVLKYTDSGIAESFCNLETQEDREKLTRSCSYPSPKSPQILKFSKLDYKQNEIWSHLKNDKLFTNRTQVMDGTTKRSKKNSLNESSFRKYLQLLPKSSIEEPKLSTSKSLRLTNEYSFRRLRSLSRTEISGVIQNEPSCDGYSEVLIEADLDSSRNIENDIHLYEDIQRSDKNVEHSSNLLESIDAHATDEVPNISQETEEIIVLKDYKKDDEIDFVEEPEEKLPHSSSFLVIQSNFDEDVMSLTGFLASEDFEFENSFLDKGSPVDSQHECCSNSPSRSSTTSNKRYHNIVDDMELLIKGYDDFNYVSDILNRSGFKRNDLLAPWYSSDQPLNPSVFDEVEACWPHEDLFPKDECCCHHQLLFDLTNEVLVQIYDTLFTYYPRALSSNCCIPPMLVKDVSDEVWGKVSNMMNSKLDCDPTVEAIVARDIFSDDHWMNLQLESECVVLELEDMFFDELLEEIICSREF